MADLASKYHLIPKVKSPQAAPPLPFPPAADRPPVPLPVTPGVGVGPLRLGMSRQRMEEAIAGLAAALSLSGELQCSRDSYDEPGCTTWRYQQGELFFMVRYRAEQAVEISVDRGYDACGPVLLWGHDVFHTPAEQLAKAMALHGPCLYEGSDGDLSTEYRFPSLGLRLWREDAFHPKLLEDECWLQTMGAVLEEQQRCRFFDLVTVHMPER